MIELLLCSYTHNTENLGEHECEVYVDDVGSVDDWTSVLIIVVHDGAVESPLWWHRVSTTQ